ncbi:hypothetical protein FOZ63_006005, partial [Perkinsus olseni]
EASIEQDGIMHRMKAVHPGAMVQSMDPTWPGQVPQASLTTAGQRTGVLEASEQPIAETCAVHTTEHKGTNSGGGTTWTGQSNPRKIAGEQTRQCRICAGAADAAEGEGNTTRGRGAVNREMS